MNSRKNSYTRITVKVGSNVLTRTDGTLDVTRMSALADQIAVLRQRGVEVILVSSGAVAAGRSEIISQHRLDQVAERQLFSAVGQAKLINRYYELFREHGIAVGQVLATKESFSTRQHYLTQRACMQVMLQNGVLPIVNENDTVSVTELMFTDNDELSGLVASMMDSQALVILSNVDGICTGDPADPHATWLRDIAPGDDLSACIRPGKSGFGRGGMLTKTRIARKVAAEGITVWIANGKRENILTDLFDCPESTPSTRFIPSAPASSIKKWIAHSDGFCKGYIQLDEEATRRITDSRQATSILPVGIVRTEGNFEEGELIHIIGADGQSLGIGKTECNAATLRSIMGYKGQRPVIHYDFLYIES